MGLFHFLKTLLNNDLPVGFPVVLIEDLLQFLAYLEWISQPCAIFFYSALSTFPVEDSPRSSSPLDWKVDMSSVNCF